ncbi:MAG TPA: DNA mismatch repair endonuclease MutL [Candidatus Omnitrophota bacterium]|nr:DNA mismatch repair endonuclease MutL [Candidatus Omnitrophota bacterium]HQB94522.1 DNA mismatch repair endonuclease MutL [Candidatus Omnitrophota bacterium]
MGTIHVLPEHVANKIAAGEVVERPASIVKELVENSLDAGADRIEIAVRHGGKSLIRVADNGPGMSGEDVQLAVQRHATSKIASAEDLGGILSFGFRGEALPSIAAVSRFTIQTRTTQSTSGTELVIEGGSLVRARECPTGQGTVIEVRDLFFNTPARRKFLKQDSTEFGHILDAVICLALANLDVHFTLCSQDKEILDLLPAGDVAARARAVFGDEWADQVLAVSGEIPYAKLTGLIGKPSLASGNRTSQFIFINKRWVRAYGLSHALQAGFHGFLMQHQFPAAVLFLEVDPHHVDVNVHPTKQQVRLSHEVMIKSLVEKTVAQALKMDGDLLPRTRSERNEHAFGMRGGEVPAATELSFSSGAVPESLKVAEAPAGDFRPVVDFPIPIGKSVSVTKIFGQVHYTYVLAETTEGYVLVDQHAAHERVMFETLLANFHSRNPASQGLLIEETFDVHPRQVELMKKNLGLLNRIGFAVELFGERSFVVRAVPAILKNENPVTVLKEFIDEKETGKVQTRLKGAEEDVAAIIACKRRSVKASDPLTVPAMQELLKLLGECKNPFNCPHGRPTLIRHAAADIEKQFKRRV